MAFFGVYVAGLVFCTAGGMVHGLHIIETKSKLSRRFGDRYDFDDVFYDLSFCTFRGIAVGAVWPIAAPAAVIWYHNKK